MVQQSTWLDTSVKDAIALMKSSLLGEPACKPGTETPHPCKRCMGVITDICGAISQNTTSGVSDVP